MDKTTETQPEAVNNQEVTAEVPAEVAAEVAAAPEAKAEEATPEPKRTLSEELSTQSSHKKPESVPLDVALQWKREAKEAKRELEEAKKTVAEAPANADGNAIADSLAQKYQLDPNFTRELVSNLSSASASEAERRARLALESELAPVREIREREQQADVRRRFDAMLDASLANRPEVKAMANRDALFQLATNPSFADKTMDDLVAEVYGPAVSPAKVAVGTVETARPARPPEEVDFSKVGSDPELAAQVFGDRATKERYNAWMLKQLGRY